jgi:ATP-binding cassette subfamily C (CFTR/MRP) protein 1
VYAHYLRNIGIFLSGATVFFNVVFQCFSIGSNVWLSEWSNAMTMYGNKTDDSKQNLYLGVYGALGAGQGKSDISVLSVVVCN